MSSSTASSSSGGRRAQAARLAALAAALALGACRHAPPPPHAQPLVRAGAGAAPFRVAVLPPDNLGATSAPLAELLQAVEARVGRVPGVEVVGGERIQEFLARQRMRYTGAVGAAAAKAAKEQLGVDALLVTSIVQYQPDPPALSLLLRLVGASDDAPILWFAGEARAWNDAPGLLGLGLVRSIDALRRQALDALAASLDATLHGRGPRAVPCDDGGTYRPRVGYRSPIFDPARPASVAVVPFRNLTARRNAGEVVALEFARQLATNPSLRVLEPGIARDALLGNRVVMEGGVSVDQVRTLVRSLGADLVVAGDVVEYGDALGAIPNANFTATVLDGSTGLIAWQSTSFNRGDDDVRFFGLGTVRTGGALTCRMIRSAVDEMARLRPTGRGPEGTRSERISR